MNNLTLASHARLSDETCAHIGQWLQSYEVCAPSLTMVCIALGDEFGPNYCAPHTAQEFACCVRVVDHFPELRNCFARIATLVPQFAGVLREWDFLVLLLRRDAQGQRSISEFDSRLPVLLRELCQQNPTCVGRTH